MTVKIPKELIARLAGYGPRFTKVAKPIPNVRRSGKAPIEHGWQDHPMEHDDPRLLDWLEQGGNYGIVCGQGLYEVDLDDVELIKKFEAKVETFTVKTGSGDGRHYYIKSDLKENGAINEKIPGEKRPKNLGNIQVRNKHVVGPNSVHYTGGKYEIIADREIAWIEKSLIEEIFGDKLSWAGASQKIALENAFAENELLGHEIPIKEIIENFDEFTTNNGLEYQGSHPVHGSEGGMNLCVNLEKNCWHCFRCNSGGGPLSWLAVAHGIIQCDEAKSGILKGERFWSVVEIAKKAGYDIDIGGEEKLNKDVSKYFEEDASGIPRFIPPILATELMNEYYYITRDDSRIIFVYNKKTGTYSADGEAHIMRECAERLGKYSRKHRVLEVIHFIECSTIQKVQDTPPHVIAVGNGLLDLKTKKLIPFDPKYFILSASPAAYEPDASQDKIREFINQIVLGDDRLTIQELAGYCLWRSLPIHKAGIFVGGGRNGKSTALKIIRKTIGERNVVSIPLHELEMNHFSRANLYGKLANLYPDLPDRALKFTGVFKQIVGGDPITANVKYKGPFDFISYAVNIFACNKIPAVQSDDTDAFFARWVIVNFPNQFLEGDPKTDTDIYEKMTTPENLSGILNWMLEGLERLLKNKKFTTSGSIDTARERYIRASDPPKAFAMDCLKFDAGSTVTKSEVYRAFVEYCKKQRLPTIGIRALGNQLITHIPQIKDTKMYVGDKQVRAWGDVKLVETLSTNGSDLPIKFMPPTGKKSSRKNAKSGPESPAKKDWMDAGRKS